MRNQHWRTLNNWYLFSMKTRRIQNTLQSHDSQMDSGLYSTVEYPEPDGKSTRHRPLRNIWGNLIEEEESHEDISYASSPYDYSDLDYEDDHDNYYFNDHYI